MPESLSEQLDRYNRHEYTSHDALQIQTNIISVKKDVDFGFTGFCTLKTCILCPLYGDHAAPCTTFSGRNKPHNYGQLKLDYMLTWLEKYFPEDDFTAEYRALRGETERLLEERYAKEPL